MKLIKEKDAEAFKNSLTGLDLKSLNAMKDPEGYTLMQRAVIEDVPDFVTVLLDAKIDANIGEGGQKPLLLAAKLGHSRILKLFVDFHKNKNSCNQAEINCKVDFDVSTEVISSEQEGERQFSGGENILHLGKPPNLILLCFLKSYFPIQT